MITSEDREIVEFDTIKDDPDGFNRIAIGMTHVVNRDEHPSWMPQYRPNVVVTAYAESKDRLMTTVNTFGIKNIDACLIEITKGIDANMHGYGSMDIHIENVARVVGKRSKYNSSERDFNTGRITVTLKMAEAKYD
jgi:hypothetical protein